MYKESSTAEDMAYAFLRIVVANHGMPENIITDRDKLVTSKFWKSLVDLMGISHKLSTAYHPQTDGQIERMNQTLEQYLRFYVNYQQDNWVTLLPVAQLAYNGAKATTTGYSPSYANYGMEPTVTMTPRNLQPIAEKARIRVENLQKLHEELAMDITFFAQSVVM